MWLALDSTVCHQDHGWIPSPGLHWESWLLGTWWFNTASGDAAEPLFTCLAWDPDCPPLLPSPWASASCSFQIIAVYTILFLWLLLIYGFSCPVAFAQTLLPHFSEVPSDTLSGCFPYSQASQGWRSSLWQVGILSGHHSWVELSRQATSHVSGYMCAFGSAPHCWINQPWPGWWGLC